ncbi:MAG: FKBP-type peptidyl-prolyl cis-trans isomerase [Muribaculaceae bacterium]|nr:FKBP-type peptidyl-prolyl cis-trans isomerase [Muribaculaceae bacterium]
MKKIILACGVAAAILGVSSCSNSTSSNGGDSAFGDSLSTTFGSSQGLRLADDYANQLTPEQQATMKKDDILRGIKQVIMTDTTQQGYLSGLGIGLQLSNQLMRYEEAGIAVDRAKVYEAYAKAFMTDSVSPEALRQAQVMFQDMAQKAQQKMMEYYEAQRKAEQEAKAATPEAKKNAEEGANYIKELAAKDKSIVVLPSGLAYKVITEGQGPAVGEGGSATVKYTGKLVDGTVFDQNEDGVSFRTNQVVPGFGEGLSMMKKGSHYLLIIPGDLAYGVDGAPAAGIGPNATLVFDVEAVDVNPAQ